MPTAAELSIVLQAQDQATKELRNATAELKKLQGATDDADKAAAGANKTTGAFGSTLGTLGAVAGGFVAANVLAGGFQKITGFIGDSIGAARESISVNAQLDAVLKSTGGIAGVTAQQIDDLSSALQLTSKFEDEAVKSSSALLLTFTAVGKDIFPRAQQAILDVSQAMGQDLQTSTVQIGKALNDPIAGLASLSRVGIQFTDDQKAVITSMVEGGNVAGAQAVILGELERQFGGSALAASNAAGSQEVMKDRMNELQEQIGTKMIPVQEALTRAKLAMVTVLTDHVIPVVEELYAKHWPAVSKAISDVVSFIETTWPTIAPVVQFYIDFVIAKIQGLIQAFSAIVEIVSSVVNLVSDIFHGRWSEAWGEMKDIAAAFIDLIVGWLKFQFGNIPGIIANALSDAVGWIWTKAGEAYNAAVEFGSNVVGGIWEQVKGLPDTLLQLGGDAIRALGGGIESAFGWLKGQVEKLIGLIPKWVRDLLGVDSPSKVFFDIGVSIVEGLAQGLIKTIPGKALSRAQKMLADVAASAAGAFSGQRIGIDLGSAGLGNVERWRPFLAAVGWPVRELNNALRIIQAESGGLADAVSPLNANGTRDVGLFQINDVHGLSFADRLNAGINAAFALDLWKRKGWQPWSTAPALGLAHSGLDYVPTTGPYILEQGERVISAADNQGAGVPIVNVYLDSDLIAARVEVRQSRKLRLVQRGVY